MLKKHIIWIASLIIFLLSIFVMFTAASLSSSLFPIADGTHKQWVPKTGTSHYTMVNETTCNGLTNYVATNKVGKRDSFKIDTNTIPNGATITQISITPCASKLNSGGHNSTLKVFYLYNGTKSSDIGNYNLNSNTPTLQEVTNFAGLSLLKNDSSNLEIGAIYTSGNRGIALSQLSAIITYIPLLAPINIQVTVTNSTAFLTWEDISSNETGFKIERSSDGTNFSQTATTLANVVSYADANLPSGNYTYRIRSYNNGADSAYIISNVIIASGIYEAGGKLWIDNGLIKAGFLENWGAALTDLISNNMELINRHDTGRLMQLSAYDGSQQYDNCSGCTGVFGWNPLQGGDRTSNGAPLIEKTLSSDTLYTKTQSIEWYPNNKGGGAGNPVNSDVIYEQWVSFVPNHPNTLKFRYKATHYGTDTHTHSSEEFPVAYINGEFENFVYYGGTNPWVNDSLSTIPYPTADSYGNVYTPELWAGYVNDNNFGTFIFSPAAQKYMYHHFYGVTRDKGPLGDSTNIVTPRIFYSFQPGTSVEWDVYLVTDYLTNARQTIYDIKNNITILPIFELLGQIDNPKKDQTIDNMVNVSGWVFDTNFPISSVDILVDGIYVGQATYGIYRPDIPQAYPNAPANTGFSYMIDVGNYTTGQHTITVKTTLNGVTFSLGLVDVNFIHNPKGFLDQVSCVRFFGWTCDADDYNHPLIVKFYDGPSDTGTFLGSTTADIQREAAVGNVCGNNVYHGYSFNTPASLFDSDPHTIYAYAVDIPSGTLKNLNQSPKTLTCNP